MKITYFFFSLTFLIFFSCSKDKVPKINSNLDLSAVSYSKNVQPIIQAKCIQCHSAGNEGVELYDYDHVAKAAVSGQLTGCLTGNTSYLSMPIGSTLDSIQVKTFVNWVDQGFQDN